ncbi:MAG: COG4223 family protein [Paracoccaceae bacterium]
MARSKKTPTDKAQEPVETPQDPATDLVEEASESVEAAKQEEELQSAPAEDAAEEAPIEAAMDAPDPIEPVEIAKPEAKTRSGFGGMFLGGVIAAAIGAGAAYYILPRVPGLIKDPELSARVEAAQAQAKSASEQAAQAGIQLEALEPRLSGLENTPGPQEALTALEEKLAALEGRVQQLEARPIPSTAASQETQEAVDRALAEMRAELSKELEAIEAQKAAATDVQASATQAAKEAAARAVFARLNAAIESGQPFTQLLDQIEANIAPPSETLVEIAKSGAPTLTALQDSFPASARAALSASISATQGETPKDRFGAFLRSQLGVRSLEPREGDDPDAILSRAEAALKQGELPSALQEISALPADGQAALADWVGLAQTRLDAKTALAELAAQLAQ